ncbi:MAG: hypothetical protein KBS52_01780, partial [Clostridiales bacterium]|nr:hypothetical protein [Candidatus Equinaster intestinalis]
MVAGVVLEKTAYSFDKPYDYAVPVLCEKACKPGCRVIVPFGNGNAERQGMVLYIKDESTENLKSISKVADAEPILSDEMLKLCEWLHETLFCTYFDAVNAVLPVGISLKIVDSFSVVREFSGTLTDAEQKVFDYLMLRGGSAELTKILGDLELPAPSLLSALLKKGAVTKNTDAVRKMKDATLKSVRAKVSESELSAYKLTEKQQSLAKALITFKNVSVKELRYFTGMSTAVIDSLVKKGVAEYYEQTLYRIPKGVKAFGKLTPINLTDEQQEAYNT